METGIVSQHPQIKAIKYETEQTKFGLSYYTTFILVFQQISQILCIEKPQKCASHQKLLLPKNT